MARKLSKDEFASKMEWEGGLVDLASYGLKADEIADKELARLWSDYGAIYKNLNKKSTRNRKAVRAMIIDPNKPKRDSDRRLLHAKGWRAVWALKDNGTWYWKWIHPSRKKAYSRNEAIKLVSKRGR